MASVRIIDVTDEPTFGLLPPCADPAFDHRTCDYWEDAERGSKANRPAWLQPRSDRAAAPRATPDNPFAPAAAGGNPFAPDGGGEPAFNPFAPAAGGGNPFAPAAGEANLFLADAHAPADNPFAPAAGDANPFAPAPRARPAVPPDAPRKLGLLARGLVVFGSYAKVLVVDDVPAAFAQFGPLSAYPRAARLRELYPQLPDAPLPAVISCIATTAGARGGGHAQRLVEAVCDDLADRGFAAVEAYPEVGAAADATSAATPRFWELVGFRLAVADDRYPVMRRELG